MKKLVVGFVLVLAVLVISAMYKASQADLESAGAANSAAQQKANLAQQTRPHDLQLLKRPAVRAACTKHAEWDMDICQTIDQKKVSIGMTAEQVTLAWGKPEKINTTITANIHREQWVYGEEYLYVQDGVLHSMQTSR
jgi:hypothetical protein